MRVQATLMQQYNRATCLRQRYANDAGERHLRHGLRRRAAFPSFSSEAEAREVASYYLGSRLPKLEIVKQKRSPVGGVFWLGLSGRSQWRFKRTVFFVSNVFFKLMCWQLVMRWHPPKPAIGGDK